MPEKGSFMRHFLLAITAASILAAPASAFINPRAHGWWNEAPAGSGQGKLYLEVAGGAWRCVGKVRVADGNLPAQKLNMECAGMARSAVAIVTEDGQFRRKVRYRLNTGIKGHITMM